MAAVTGQTWTVADANTREYWKNLTRLDEWKNNFWDKYMADGKDAVIQKMMDLKNQPSESITYEFLCSLVGGGLTGGDTDYAYSSATGLASSSSYGTDAGGRAGTLGDGSSVPRFGQTAAFSVDTAYGKGIGKEEPMRYRSDTVYIMQKNISTRKPSAWWDQILMDNFRRDAKGNLSDWYRRFKGLMIANHLCGNTSWLFPRACLAPSTHTTVEMNRHLFARGKASIGDLTTDCYFSTYEIDMMVELARTSYPRIHPYSMDGQEVYPIVIHPYQESSLRHDPAWVSGHEKADVRGPDNAIWTGSLGKWNSAVLFSYEFIMRKATGAGTSSNLPYARAILLGKGAGCYAEGMSPGWLEDATSSEADCGMRPGIFLVQNFGFKKTQIAVDGVSAVDMGVIALDSYAAPVAQTI